MLFTTKRQRCMRAGAGTMKRRRQAQNKTAVASGCLTRRMSTLDLFVVIVAYRRCNCNVTVGRQTRKERYMTRRYKRQKKVQQPDIMRTIHQSLRADFACTEEQV